MSESCTLRENFLNISSALIDFNKFVLNGTGQGDAYLETTLKIVGHNHLSSLLTAFKSIDQSQISKEIFLEIIRKEILGDTLFGPIARNIMKLWYTGMWYQLPLRWRQKYGESTDDSTHFINSASYMEGLLWKTIDAPPSGAKGPGFASWYPPPRINFDNSWKLNSDK